MEPIDITRYPLPTSILKSLLTLVKVAERNEVMSLFYVWQQSEEEFGAFDLMIDDHEKGEYVIVPRLREDAIAVLEKSGFVERLSKNKVLLHPEAFERAKYERVRFGRASFDEPFEFPEADELEAVTKPAKATAQIFLCYAQEDEEKVEDLYQKLSDAGFKPWMAKRDILPGEIWELCIYRAIQRSDFFLACLSANSVDKRGFLQKEIKKALDVWQEKLEEDIYLIPVRLEDCEVPENLRKFHWVNLFEEDGWTRLVKAIQVGMERRAETSAQSVAEAEQPEHEQRPVLSLYTVASTESEIVKAELLAFVANGNQNEVTSTESAVMKAEQLRADSIKWDKSGNLFWASHDLMWTIDALLTGAPREVIGYGLRQSLHHVQALGIDGPPIESKLAELKARAEETTDWTPSLRSSYAVQLASIKDAIGDLASANQPDFDPGPKK